jgi:hypothetical protein
VRALCLRATTIIAAAVALGIASFGAHAATPKIWGTPPTTATSGTWYNFVPSAYDADGTRLKFFIKNRPYWLAFNPYNGQLSKTPTLENIGTYSNIVISVSDGYSLASLPPFSITVRASSSNHAPTISGTPATSVRVGLSYSFTPTARDVDGNALSFSISNKPAWASFNTSTGRLYGTPSSSQLGTYWNIVIRVSDGRASASLPAFSIAVTQSASGGATLSWLPPTRNSNGTVLTNLAGYRIYYGTSSSSMTQRIQVANPGIASYVVSNLSPATWYFNVRAYSTSGAESAASNTASKTVR